MVREADAVDDVRASVTASAEDAVLVNVHDDAGRTVHAYRPVVGSRRPYYLRTRDGGPVVTDSLRNALAQLPVEARTVPDEHRESVLHDSGRQAWNVLTYAVWRDRVQRNSDLSVVPSTDRLEWSIPADGRTTVELGGE